VLTAPPHIVVAALALVSLAVASVAPAAQLPERPPPAGFTSINGAIGGRTLAGTFTGNARSAAAVLGGMLGGPRGYFDRDYADAVVKSDPIKFRLVPPSQYRTTD
jgi:hypothetical protein